MGCRNTIKKVRISKDFTSFQTKFNDKKSVTGIESRNHNEEMPNEENGESNLNIKIVKKSFIRITVDLSGKEKMYPIWIEADKPSKLNLIRLVSVSSIKSKMDEGKSKLF